MQQVSLCVSNCYKLDKHEKQPNNTHKFYTLWCTCKLTWSTAHLQSGISNCLPSSSSEDHHTYPRAELHDRPSTHQLLDLYKWKKRLVICASMTRSIYYLAKSITLNNSIMGRTVDDHSQYIRICASRRMCTGKPCMLPEMYSQKKPLAHRVHRLYMNYL